MADTGSAPTGRRRGSCSGWDRRGRAGHPAGLGVRHDLRRDAWRLPDQRLQHRKQLFGISMLQENDADFRPCRRAPVKIGNDVG